MEGKLMDPDAAVETFEKNRGHEQAHGFTSPKAFSPKRLFLVAMDGPNKQVEAACNSVAWVLENKFSQQIMFKTMSYDPNYPEELIYQLGETMKFITNGRFQPNGKAESQEPLSEEELTFRQQVSQFWRLAKPYLSQLGKEVWYSKADLAKKLEKEAAEKRELLEQHNQPPNANEKPKEEGRISTRSKKL